MIIRLDEFVAVNPDKVTAVSRDRGASATSVWVEEVDHIAEYRVGTALGDVVRMINRTSDGWQPIQDSV